MIGHCSTFPSWSQATPHSAAVKAMQVLTRWLSLAVHRNVIHLSRVMQLQAMFKAPITESKQVEHIVNERRILEEATSEFCVGMVRAYQDRNCLYLLQDLVSGGLEVPDSPSRGSFLGKQPSSHLLQAWTGVHCIDGTCLAQMRRTCCCERSIALFVDQM